jgi:hypothetical protein
VTMRQVFLVGIAFCLSIAGCDRAELMKKITPAEDEMFARARVDLLRQHRLEQIEQELDPSISDSNAKDTLTTMAGLFPADEPKSIKVVDVKFLHSPNSSSHSLTLEYEYPQTWLLVNISIKRMNGLSTIAAFSVTPIADSLESINKFSLVGKSALQYMILGLALAGPVFCVFVLIVCLRTKNQHLKWLWAIFILFGVGRLAINWTTRELTFTPMAVHIPCASATAVPAYGPWVVAISLPLGAILFLIKRSWSLTPGEVRSSPAEPLPPTLPE